MFVVAIDGPAGTGKSTITIQLAKRLNLVNIDTGAMYRCVALEIINKKIELQNIEEITKVLNNMKIEFKTKDNIEYEKQLVFLNNVDVTDQIRNKDVTDIVTFVSSVPIVRHKLIEMQRKLAKNKRVVMEGRDIGTYVFPNADVKIYLDADIEVRAKRRYKENQVKGISITYEEVFSNIKIRDENEMQRDFGTLKPANDAHIIDTSNISIEQVIEKIISII